MTDNDRPRSLLAVWLVCAVLLLLLLYVLSIGPAFWLYDRDLISRGTFEVFDIAYAPVYFVSDRCPPLQRAIAWYIACGLSSNSKSIPPTL